MVDHILDLKLPTPSTQKTPAWVQVLGFGLLPCTPTIWNNHGEVTPVESQARLGFIGRQQSNEDMR